MRKVCEYAVYKGDEFITLGTAIECAAFMGWKKAKHTQFFASPTYQKRVKEDGNGLVVIKLEDDEDET
ncbi:MAG TPA: hypothetical protein VI423_02980 [Paenisporosarcina sp.]|nr:hypothetical protein [Paenisporosarcina sp.]